MEDNIFQIREIYLNEHIEKKNESNIRHKMSITYNNALLFPRIALEYY